MTVVVRWRGKTRGAIGFALIFLLHFLHQGKKWKTNNRKIDKINKIWGFEKVHYRTVRCRVKPGMTAARDMNDGKQVDYVKSNMDF